ncbi:hypothetical protein KIPB_010083 [Kipferlia bialata]|uniref:Kelch-type beta propeller n=1 Tax=Kipferlia bialata TaxID=797122 RepID=A0A391NPK3_9EUKA|nr:hypothetical protein KIPB_010083 [Kipferlia bialata]|eukprot:g10083.t1
MSRLVPLDPNTVMALDEGASPLEIHTLHRADSDDDTFRVQGAVSLDASEFGHGASFTRIGGLVYVFGGLRGDINNLATTNTLSVIDLATWGGIVSMYAWSYSS